MCGITGFLDITKSTTINSLKSNIKQMSDSIKHRGPDDSGDWCDPESGIALGFRRLSIIDLTPTGHQPMFSADHRFVMVFNGEIYNYQSLRDELLKLGHSFNGTSDTEIMLASILQWGLKKAITKLNGMFAIGLWDRQEKTLHLVRDRLGIKPLYYGWFGNIFLFGSELKTLRHHPGFEGQINRDALSQFMRFSYIPSPNSIYQGVYKLQPGSILTINAEAPRQENHPQPYWTAKDIIQSSMAQSFAGGDFEAINVLETRLTNSIGLRMIADVPLGAFLSGGIDSSVVVALMQKQSNRPVQTFTIGFNETGFDEALHARAVAKHLRTDHTELYISPEETLSVIPRLPILYDEPFADPSQIPTFLVSQLARKHVTVSLSGDGGDELLGGYNRYFWTDQIWNNVGHVSQTIRKQLSRGINAIPPKYWNLLLHFSKFSNPADKIYKFASLLEANNPESIYLNLISQWKNPSDLVVGAHEPETIINASSSWTNERNLSENMMALDLVTYLPDDILAKVDRASMGTSLEVRAPFLDDHETVEFAWKLPLKMKIRDGKGKWILRQLLYRHVPREMVDRPKMGFGVPIDSWLRGPLKGWAQELLDEKRILKEGYLYPTEIRKKWEEHVSGSRNWQYDLWNVLMFQAWLEEQSH